MGITGYGPNSLKLLKEAVSTATSANEIVFSEFVTKEDRYR